MRRAWAAPALAATLAISGCSSSGETKAGSGKSGRTLKLHAKQTAFAPIFLSKRGFKPGDAFIFTDKIDGGGRMIEHCVISPGEPTVFFCTDTFDLRDGQIVAEGLAPPPGGKSYTLPVVGGSGSYEGARGSMRTTGEGRTGQDVTIRLR